MIPTTRTGDETTWAQLSEAPQLVDFIDGPGPRSVLRVRLPRTTSSAAVVRSLVGTLLEHRDAPAECRDDVVLAVSEASTNAIEHGRGPHLEVTVELDDDTCLVSVGNGLAAGAANGDTLAEPESPALATLHADAPRAMPATSSVRGRGVALMEMVMDEVSFELLRDRCVVAMVRRFREGAPPPAQRSFA